MKKFFFFALATFFACYTIMAQCSIIPGAQTTPGVNPTAENLPCIERGVAYSKIIQAQIDTAFDTTTLISGLVTPVHFTIDSMRLDSVTGLPTGTNWIQNPNILAGGGNGCVGILGTTTDPTGRYYITGWGTVWTQMHFSVFGFTVDTAYVYQGQLNTLASWGNYYVDVINQGDACHPLVAANIGSNQTVCNGANITLNLVVTGGGTPYSYMWSATGNSLSCNNCQNPTATITQNSTYRVTVTDANNASATAQVTYSVASNSFQISATGPTTFCQGGSVTLNAGSGYSAYHWSNNATGSSITATQAGSYSVTVTGTGGCTYSDSKSVTVNTPTISNYQIVANGPTSFCNGGSVTLNAGTGFSSYLWSNNSTSQTITVSQTANYLVTVLGTDGCTYTDAQNVNTNTSFNGQQICIVTVDPATGKNVIVWEKSGGFGIDSFKIYRETNIANNYQLIRKQYFSNFSTYEDGLSNPQQASDRYVITTVDACGESAYGTPHQTIHLTSNVGINNEVNLIWNDYEGFSYPSFNIYRGSSQGNMQQITSVSSNTFSYSDLTPPGPPLYYQIEVVNPNGCVPTAKTESYGSSLSNIVQLSTLSVGANNQDDLITAYCYYNENSSENIVRINFKGPPSGSLKLYDVSGRIAFTISDITSKEIQLPNTLSKGIYVADINTQNFSSRNKIFIR